MKLPAKILSCLIASLFLLPLWRADADARTGSAVMHAGYRSISFSLPSQRLLLKLSVWYPAKRRPSAIKQGYWSFRAARNAPILHGPWPVIVLSHDNAGSSLSHHDLAALFASRGYIVIAPTHDHDNAYDMALLFHDRELFIRALQVKSAVDLLMEHASLGPEMDRSRIAYLGFGLPASAGLLLAGASVSPDGWQDFYSRYCPGGDRAPAPAPESAGRPSAVPDGGSRQEAEDGGADILMAADPALLAPASPAQGSGTQAEAKRAQPSYWCSPTLSHKMDRLVRSMRQRAEEKKIKALYAATASAERTRMFKRLSDLVAWTHKYLSRQPGNAHLPMPPVVLPLLPPPSEGDAMKDSRFAAMAFVSPGFSFLFDRESLADVSIPALFIGLEDDKLNIPREQAGRFVSLIGKNAEFALIHHGDAQVFQAKCPENDPASALASLCGNISDDDRAMLHQQLAALLSDFFARAFAAGGRQQPDSGL